MSIFLLSRPAQFSFEKNLLMVQKCKKLRLAQSSLYTVRLAMRELVLTLVRLSRNWTTVQRSLFSIWPRKHQQFLKPKGIGPDRAYKLSISKMIPKQNELFKLRNFAAILSCESLLSVKIWGYMCIKKIISCRKKSGWFH